jgi:hypothetical protein
MARFLSRVLDFLERAGEDEDSKPKYEVVSQEEVEELLTPSQKWIGFLFKPESVNVAGVVKVSETDLVNYFFEKKHTGSFSLAKSGSIYYHNTGKLLRYNPDNLSTLLSLPVNILYVKPFDGNRSMTRVELYTLLDGLHYDTSISTFCTLRSSHSQRDL